MPLVLDTPTRLRISGHERGELEDLLTYRDLTVDFELSKFQRNAFFHKQRMGKEAYQDHLEELKASRKKCLLFEDEQGLWTFSGFYDLLSHHLGETVQRSFECPSPGKPFRNLTPFARDPRPYQLEGNEALLAARHGAVEIGTGLGKSFMALKLVEYLGQQAVIQAPSTNIAEQLFEDFRKAFGSKMVGMYGDGKKEYRRPITVAIAASLARLEPGTPAYDTLSQAKVFIGDEAHTIPAKTLAKVNFGLMSGAPYRMFFTGTHMRGDGAGLLLEGITGPVVYRMSVKDGVDQGWLARPHFKIVNVNSSKKYYNKDADKMTRTHLYYNEDVLRKAAEIANQCVEHLNHQVLILIEEFEQFMRLLPFLRFKCAFAHGPVTKDNAEFVPEQYQKVDNAALVEDFNARKFPILVGTSCISTGTDIQPAETLIFLRGGKSEVQVRQSIGRGTRKIAGQNKTDFNFVDFRVHVDCMPDGQQSVVERHLDERLGIYEEVYPGATEEIS